MFYNTSLTDNQIKSQNPAERRGFCSDPWYPAATTVSPKTLPNGGVFVHHRPQRLALCGSQNPAERRGFCSRRARGQRSFQSQNPAERRGFCSKNCIAKKTNVCPKTLPNGGVFVPHIYHILRGVVKSNTHHLVERDEGTCVAVEICHGVEVPDRKLKQPDRDASRSEACDARVFRRQTATAVLVLYLEPIFAAAQPALPLNKN